MGLLRGGSRSMSLLSSSPGSYSIVCADKVVADQDCVVAVCDPSYHLSIHRRSPVSALVVRTQRL